MSVEDAAKERSARIELEEGRQQAAATKKGPKKLRNKFIPHNFT
jgi:hypothetical protein